MSPRQLANLVTRTAQRGSVSVGARLIPTSFKSNNNRKPERREPAAPGEASARLP
jgi:hypothetical protein